MSGGRDDPTAAGSRATMPADSSEEGDIQALGSTFAVLAQLVDRLEQLIPSEGGWVEDCPRDCPLLHQCTTYTGRSLSSDRRK